MLSSSQLIIRPKHPLHFSTASGPTDFDAAWRNNEMKGSLFTRYTALFFAPVAKHEPPANLALAFNYHMQVPI